MGKEEPDVCPDPETGPGLLGELFTDADILAKRHEYETEQEQKHKAELAKMEKTICELEQRKKKDEVQFRMALHQAIKRSKRAEMRIVAARHQHELCLEDVKEQYAIERAGYKENLDQLQMDLDADKQTYQDKQEELKRAKMANLQTLDKRAKDQDAVKDEIENLQKKLSEMAWAHEAKKRGYSDNAEERVRAFQSDSDKLRARIDEAKAEADKKNVAFRRQEMELIRQRDEILGQQQLDREEMEIRMGGLMMEKDDYTERIAFLEKKVQQRQEVEKRRAIEVNKQFDDIMRSNENNLRREREEISRKILMKEDELRQMEGELVRVRESHDYAIKHINDEIDKFKRESQRELKVREEHYKGRIDDITDKNRHRDLEDAIHNKRCLLLNIESDQEAEELYLQARLKALADKEKFLRDSWNNREMKFSDYLISLENELGQTRIKANNEQHEYDVMKGDLDKKVAEHRFKLEDDIRELTGRLNAVNKAICDLERDMKDLEELGRERENNLEERIGDEIRRLQTVKADLEEQIPPLQERHNLIKNFIQDERDRHEDVMKALVIEHKSVGQDQEEEMNNMRKMLEERRNDFADQKAELMTRIKDCLDLVENTRMRREKELYNLHVKLVDALQGKATFDKESTKEKLKTISDLQDTYAKKSREYEDLVIHGIGETYGPDKNHEGTVRQLNVDFKWLRREYMKDGIAAPDQRLEKIKAMLETKKKQQEKSGGDDQSPIMDNVEEAKVKNSELRNQLREKKKEMKDLMDKRQKEISELTEEILKSTQGKTGKGGDDDVQSEASQSGQQPQQPLAVRCVLDAIPGAEMPPNAHGNDESSTEGSKGEA